ncbi:MAG: toprim domain-containing protein [Bacteroidales bacterium]|nr:toprim domain-containing protein [Bacteroidales bacterium]
MADTATIPKYINSRETSLYTKGQTFFGLTQAFAGIRKSGSAYLVEGNPDVIRMHEIGITNTIAPLGTALSQDQAEWLKKQCTRVTIIGDSDDAGKKAVVRNAEILIRLGLFVNLITLPDDSKEDPDSFFAAHDFAAYEKENHQDYILWFAQQKAEKAKRPDVKHELIGHISELIHCLPESSHELYVEQVCKLIKPKKAWTDELKQLSILDAPKSEKEDRFIVPQHVDANTFEEYGFYEDQYRYFFRTSKGIIRGSNFVMRPLFHVESVNEAKRLFEIINEFGYKRVIELAQRDLVSLQSFKLRVESIGNFLWEAGDVELNKLKRYIYEKTATCIEIKQLGWQKEGFWAWGNGIYNGAYHGVNEFGIVDHNESNYYIPAFSKIYVGEHNLFVSERRFIHHPGAAEMFDIVFSLEKVFGPNARIAYCFYLATCFRDIIVGRFGFFPMLNLFGPKGAGKTEMAISMLHFFGKQNRGPNINNTSKAALADHIAQHCNALCHIDEYKNNMEFEKIEFLKGIWDGTGRTRMNMEKDKKKETTSVDVGLMLSGQEMPTADIALFSRMLFITFTQTEYNDDEKQRFNELKDTLHAGVTHLTHEVLSNRKHFIENYWHQYDEVCSEINALLGTEVIEDRIFRNWVIVIAAFRTLKDRIKTHINYKELLQQSVELIMRQNKETKRTNDVANFWDIFTFLVKENELVDKVDFKVLFRNEDLTTDRGKIGFAESPRNIIYLNHTRIFQKYRKHGAQTRDMVLPIKTLEYYLANSKEYYGKVRSTAFIMKSGMESAPDTDGKVQRQITTAMLFDYEMLSNNYDVNVILGEAEDEEVTTQNQAF